MKLFNSEVGIHVENKCVTNYLLFQKESADIGWQYSVELDCAEEDIPVYDKLPLNLDTDLGLVGDSYLVSKSWIEEKQPILIECVCRSSRVAAHTNEKGDFDRMGCILTPKKCAYSCPGKKRKLIKFDVCSVLSFDRKMVAGIDAPYYCSRQRQEKERLAEINRRKKSEKETDVARVEALSETAYLSDIIILNSPDLFADQFCDYIESYEGLEGVRSEFLVNGHIGQLKAVTDMKDSTLILALRDGDRLVTGQEMKMRIAQMTKNLGSYVAKTIVLDRDLFIGWDVSNGGCLYRKVTSSSKHTISLVRTRDKRVTRVVIDGEVVFPGKDSDMVIQLIQQINEEV